MSVGLMPLAFLTVVLSVHCTLFRPALIVLIILTEDPRTPPAAHPLYDLATKPCRVPNPFCTSGDPAEGAGFRRHQGHAARSAVLFTDVRDSGGLPTPSPRAARGEGGRGQVDQRGGAEVPDASLAAAVRVCRLPRGP